MRRSWILVLALALIPGIPLSAEQRARLELRVNQKRVGEIEVFFRGDDILVRVPDLNAAGIDPTAGRLEAINSIPHVSLKSLGRNWSFEMIEADLSLRLTAKQATENQKSVRTMQPSRASPIQNQHNTRRTADSREQQARLALSLDGIRKGDFSVILRNDDVFARLKDAEELGIKVAPALTETIQGQIYVSLKSLAPGLDVVLDETDLTLNLRSRPQRTDSSLAVLKPTSQPAFPQEETPPKIAQSETDQRAIFVVRVNELRKGESDVILRGQDVFARVKDLQELGINRIQGRQEVFYREAYVSLRSLAPGLSFSIDENELALDLAVSPELFGEHTIAIRDYRPEKLEYREDSSSFLNYAFGLNNLKSINAFGEMGVTIKNALLYNSLSKTLDGHIVRGLSNITISDRGNSNRFIVGDRLINSDFLGGSLTVGGLSYFRDFALDPYFIRNPGLNFSGAVSTPSTLDVYSSGRLLRRLTLPPGQFHLQDFPVPTGSSDTRFVIRDAFGRERDLGSQYFYFTSGLLKPGLQDFSYNLGSRRDNLGTSSADYGSPVFLGYHRYGFSDRLTAGLRLESSKGLVSGGPSFSFLLPYGEMELASAASTEHGLNGRAGFVGYTYIDRLFSLGALIKLQTDHYATTILKATDQRSWLEAGTYVAFPVTDLTGVNLRYGFETSHQEGSTHRFRLFTNTRLNRNLSLLIGGNVDIQGGDRSLGFNIGLSLTLGEHSAALTYQRDAGESSAIFDVRKGLPMGPGYGYGLQADTKGDFDSLFQYQTSFGRYEANYSRLSGQQQSELRVAGGVAVIDGIAKFTRPVQDSFALIKLPGLSGVRGYLNNLEVGTTDSQGRLFVPNLLAYYGNNLGISRKDLPLNYNVDITDKIIAAPYRGGALVEFPVARIQRVVGKVIILSGVKTIVPKYGQLTITGQGQTSESPLGNDGEFYFENLKSGRYQAQIETKDHTCDFYFDMAPSSDERIQLGVLNCVAQ